MNFRASAWADDGKVSRTEITQERFRAIATGRTDVLLGIQLEEKLSLLIDNFCEFERDLLGLAHEATIWPRHAVDTSMTHRLVLDRRLVNLLTACRLYLDQTEHNISDMFGRQSDELARIREFKHELHRKHWGYRFLEAVRNHVQHAGLPVHKISYNFSAVGEPGSGQVETSVIPASLVRFFEADTRFKKATLEELKTHGEEIDLRSPIREYVSCIVLLHDELRRVTHERLEAGRAVYASALSDYTVSGGKRILLLEIEEHDDTADAVGARFPLSASQLERLDALLRHNTLTKDLWRYNVSNRDRHAGSTTEQASTTIGH